MESRIFSATDIEECAALYAKVFSSEPWKEAWTIDKAHTRVKHFFECRGFIGVALRDGETLIGFCFGNSEPFVDGDIFYLREMCVAHEFQKQGLGTLLLNALEKQLKEKNINSYYLTTDNKIPAAKLYLKNGFKYSSDMGFYMKNVKT